MRLRLALISLLTIGYFLTPVAEPLVGSVVGAPSVEFTAVEPFIEFPEGITFGLQATSDVPIVRVELRYHVGKEIKILLLSIAEMKTSTKRWILITLST